MSIKVFLDAERECSYMVLSKKEVDCKMEQELKEQISKIIENDLIVFNKIDIEDDKVRRIYYRDKFEFDFIYSLNKLLFIGKEKSNKDYDTTIISKKNYFLIKTLYEVIKINKEDIIKVVFDNYDCEVKFILKDKELIIKLNKLSSGYKIENKYVLFNISYNQKKIVDFFYDEIEDFIDQKNLISNL